MDGGSRCPRCGFTNPMVASLNDALLAIGRERALHATLHQVVDAARRLASARCAILAIAADGDEPDEVVVAGAPPLSSDAALDALRTSGLLERTLSGDGPLRIPDVADAGHDVEEALGGLRSFLGVPLSFGGQAVGSLHLFGRQGAPAFTAADQEGVQMLAYHAVLAIENARLYERSRELTVVAERNRLARELHDAVSQTLFSIVLTAGTIETLLRSDPEAAAKQVSTLREMAQEAQREMRSLIFELRPADVDHQGLIATIRSHIDVLRRVHAASIELTVSGEEHLAPAVERELFRIQQEALSNALRHARASKIRLDIRYEPTMTRMTIADDGEGFDPRGDVGGKRLGLTSMRERAAGLGGILTIESAPGRGTSVCVEVPRDR